MNGQRGFISYALIFLVGFLLLTGIFAILFPSVQTFHIQMWGASEDIISDNSTYINRNIDDAAVKASFNEVVDAQADNVTTNVEVLGFLNQYAWFFIIIMIMLAIYLQVRIVTEVNQF